ncbi:hypothetical protein B0H14DRAFT_2564953 [Mycena olivaceomarginata]|nr:hypothetical protein B0H14DRAFT_2564953 [Mycena olivaceomarginata]
MLITLYLASCIAVTVAFLHPGIWHNSTNLAEIKAKSTSTNSVWKAAYAIFRDNSYTSSNYTLEGPNAVLNTTSTGPADPRRSPCNQAAQILDGWATTMTAIANPDQTILRLAIGFPDGAMLINAAELLVYTGSAIMSAGVFYDNQTLYQYGLDLITGAKTQSSTLCESGRDQGHTQLELGHISESCQIARSQGDGGACFATSSNLLVKGFEYTSVVLWNGTVVWNPDAFATCNDIWWSRSTLAVTSLGLRPEYELPYAYYHSVAKMSVDNIGAMVTLQRPEGQEPAAGSIADSIGFGTLLWAY